MKKFLCLGIESTAHTIAVAIIDEDCNILSHEKKMFTTEKGGLIPRELSEHHSKNIHPLIKSALEKSKKNK